MAYVIDRRRALADDVQRIGLEKCNGVLADLVAARNGETEAVHRARKRIKKLRGLLRLIRPAGKDFYKTHNDRLRDAARQLAGLREMTAALETLERVSARYAEAPPADTLPVLTARLGHEQDSHVAAAGEELAAAIAPAETALLETRSAFAAFEAPKKPGAAKLLAQGSGATYRRGRKALRAAKKDQTDEAFHELRKQVKYHWMHVALLQRLTKGAKSRRKRLKALADTLGDLHDIDMMQLRLAAPESAGLLADEVAMLTEWLARERKRLAKNALKSGKKLFERKPADLSAEIGKAKIG